MPEQAWLLLPWCLFAVAAGFKFWQLNRSIRRQLRRSRPGTADFRQTLERIWRLDAATHEDSGSQT